MMTDKTAIKNIIVLMLENRSYDNLFGRLYDKDNLPPYNIAPTGQVNLKGLSGDECNPTLSGDTIYVTNQVTPTKVNNTKLSFSATSIPMITPGEPFKDMAQQYTGSRSAPTSNPYKTWPPENKINLMNGFVFNYEGKVKNKVHYQDVMNYFNPRQIPVSAFLANKFSICDSWYASVPTHTYSNRSFLDAAAPGVGKELLSKDYYSFMDDWQYFVDEFCAVKLPTIYRALDLNPIAEKDSNANWKIYYHDFSIAVQTTGYVEKIANCKTNINISTYDNSDWGNNIPNQLKVKPTTFVEDIENGTLPPYSMIEPRYSRNYTALHGGLKLTPAANSNHPGPSSYLGGEISADNPPIDVLSGELLLMQVYNQLRKSKYWQQSLLVVIYDEPGGIYDHVSPPIATPPDKINWLGQINPPFDNIPAAQCVFDKAADNFNFNVYGGRVPALVISPFVESGSTLKSTTVFPFDHSSIIRTVLDTLGQESVHLNERNRVAPSIVKSTNFNEQSVINDTGIFFGEIICSPASLSFKLSLLDHHHTCILEVSAGYQLVEAHCDCYWLSLNTDTSMLKSRGLLKINVTVKKLDLGAGHYESLIRLKGDGIPTVEVPVTLCVDVL
jgi:phospholipase C